MSQIYESNKTAWGLLKKRRQIEQKINDKNKLRVKKNKGGFGFPITAQTMLLCRMSFVCGWGNRQAPWSYDTTHSTISLFDFSLLQCEVLLCTDLLLLLFLLGSLSIIEINKGNRLNVCCLSHKQMFLQGKTRLSVQEWVQERGMYWVRSSVSFPPSGKGKQILIFFPLGVIYPWIWDR